MRESRIAALVVRGVMLALLSIVVAAADHAPQRVVGGAAWPLPTIELWRPGKRRSDRPGEADEDDRLVAAGVCLGPGMSSSCWRSRRLPMGRSRPRCYARGRRSRTRWGRHRLAGTGAHRYLSALARSTAARRWVSRQSTTMVAIRRASRHRTLGRGRSAWIMNGPSVVRGALLRSTSMRCPAPLQRVDMVSRARWDDLNVSSRSPRSLAWRGAAGVEDEPSAGGRKLSNRTPGVSNWRCPTRPGPRANTSATLPGIAHILQNQPRCHLQCTLVPNKRQAQIACTVG